MSQLLTEGTEERPARRQKNCKIFELEELENPYLFDGNKWLYYIDNKWIPLCTVLSQIKMFKKLKITRKEVDYGQQC